jgi:hypothetical protein
MDFIYVTANLFVLQLNPSKLFIANMQISFCILCNSFLYWKYKVTPIKKTDMRNNKVNNNQDWTTKQLINLSQSWGYVLPVNVSQRAKANSDEWTTEQFIRVGYRYICL